MTDTLTEDVGKTWTVKVRREAFDNDAIRALGFDPDTVEGDQLLAAGLEPYDVAESEGNLLVNGGIQRMLDLLIVAGGQGYDATHSRIGVGNSTTAAAATDTDLIAAAGSSNRQFKVMDATYPSRASQTVSWKSTFASADANFAWAEWCIDVGTADGTTVVTPMLNRKVTALGTKASGATWTLTVQITIS